MKFTKNLCLMCSNCYDIKRIPGIEIDFGDLVISPYIQNFDLSAVFHCDKCDRNVDLIDVDENIAESIAILNLNGIRTLYSCQGHSEVCIFNEGSMDEYKGCDYTNPYILIDVDMSDKKNLAKLLSSIEHNEKRISNGCTIHGWSYEETPNFSYRGDIIKVIAIRYGLPNSYRDCYRNDNITYAKLTSRQINIIQRNACHLLEEKLKHLF